MFFIIFNTCFSNYDFDELMGKNTELFDKIKTKEDFENYNFFKKIYDKQKRFQTENGCFRIPQVLHFIWLGSTNIPNYFTKNLKRWMKNNPEWKVKFWMDKNIKALPSKVIICNVRDFSFSKLKELYESTSNFSEKEMLLKYEILLKEGGVYIGPAVKSIANFDPLNISYDFFASLVAPHNPIPSSTIYVGVDIIGSKPYHPVIEKCIDLVQEKWLTYESLFPESDIESKLYKITNRTVLPFTQAVMKNLNLQHNRDIIFPAGYFYKIKEPLFAYHSSKNNWVRGEETFQEKAQKHMRELTEKIRFLHLSTIFLFFFIIFSILWGFSYIRKTRLCKY